MMFQSRSIRAGAQKGAFVMTGPLTIHGVTRDVTIPVSGGRIDFNRATVEHIGPDSSMGVSRMGVYVDAPNGRTYVYLLSATHVPGAAFERRGGLLSSRVSDRGSIDLQPCAECFLRRLNLAAPCL